MIYEENHSFDNLYGGWEGVRGLADADAAHTTQLGQTGPEQLRAVPVPLPGRREPAGAVGGQPVGSAERRPATTRREGRSRATSRTRPFSIDDYIAPTDVTCPPVLNAFGFPNGLRKGGINPANGLVVPGARPGGCTRDIVHRFYEEQFQLNGGQQNRYALRSDAAGLVMGTYDTTKLPDLPLPARAPAPALRDPGQLLPGRVRRLVPEPPVPDRSGPAGLQRQPTAARPARRTRCSTATAARRWSTPPASSRPPGMGVALHLARQRPEQRRADAVVRPADDDRRLRLRRLQRQHAAAALPAVAACSAPSSPRRRTRRSVTG